MLCITHSKEVPLYLQQLQYQKEALPYAIGFSLQDIADILAIYTTISACVATLQKHHLDTIEVINPITVR